jgi:hypothetical protein
VLQKNGATQQQLPAISVAAKNGAIFIETALPGRANPGRAMLAPQPQCGAAGIFAARVTAQFDGRP